MTVTVGVRELRENLRAYLQRVKAGEDVIITERGRPIARLTHTGAARDRFEELVAAGVITPARRPKGKLPEPVEVAGSVTEILLEQRRAKDY